MISNLETLSAPGTAAPKPADNPQPDASVSRAPSSALVETRTAPALPPVCVPHGTLPVLGTGVDLQRIGCVRSYLAARRPVMFWEDEEVLIRELRGSVKAEAKAKQAVAEYVFKLVKEGFKVEPAVKAALAAFKASGACTDFHPTRFRAQYDAWVKQRDWLVFVNRAKAGANWQVARVDGVPEEFLTFVAARRGQYKGRGDTRKEALRSIYRQWRTGKNLEGQIEAVPGYGFARDWWAKNNKPIGSLPPGWHYSNICRLMDKKNVLPRAAELLLTQGTHAAKDFVPQVLGKTEHLRFLEEVQFDDVKTDWRVFDPVTKQPMDLWLLIARDRATRLLLGFGMRPAKARDDGTQEHLKLRDMKQLCGWILERYGIPPYVMRWKIERGTATLSEGSVQALREMIGGNIEVSYSSMIGGISPAGYFEKRIGNSKGKASLESHNRTVHIIGAHLPGQTGPSYGKRPTDLAAREKECKEIAALADFLPVHLKDELGYGLLLIEEAREELRKIFTIQNERDDHNLEGFRNVLEGYDERNGVWVPRHLAPAGAVWRKRKETPKERAAWLVHQTLEEGGRWSTVSPEIITAFYEHTQRPVKVGAAGEIEFKHEGHLLTFISPVAHNMGQGTALLGYFHPDDPSFLHLTNGDGAIVGTWLLRGLAGNADEVSKAIAYSAASMKSARELADELAAPERVKLDAMRAHNAAVVARANDFTDVAQVDGGASARPMIESPVAAAMAGVTAQRAKSKQQKRDLARTAADAKAALRDAHL